MIARPLAARSRRPSARCAPARWPQRGTTRLRRRRTASRLRSTSSTSTNSASRPAAASARWPVRARYHAVQGQLQAEHVRTLGHALPRRRGRLRDRCALQVLRRRVLRQHRERRVQPGRQRHLVEADPVGHRAPPAIRRRSSARQYMPDLSYTLQASYDFGEMVSLGINITGQSGILDDAGRAYPGGRVIGTRFPLRPIENLESGSRATTCSTATTCAAAAAWPTFRSARRDRHRSGAGPHLDRFGPLTASDEALRSAFARCAGDGNRAAGRKLPARLRLG